MAREAKLGRANRGGELIAPLLAVVFSVLSIGGAWAANVEYVGSSSSGDVSLPANWGGTLPTTSDTAMFPVGFLCPSAGLTLGQALTLGSFAWKW